MKKCYYSRPFIFTGSDTEINDIHSLEKLGFEVVNYLSHSDKNSIKDCDILFFRSFPNNKIFKNSSLEIDIALLNDIPIAELQSNIDNKVMSITESVDIFKKLGYFIGWTKIK